MPYERLANNAHTDSTDPTDVFIINIKKHERHEKLFLKSRRNRRNSRNLRLSERRAKLALAIPSVSKFDRRSNDSWLIEQHFRASIIGLDCS